jgi:hypothetical protein
MMPRKRTLRCMRTTLSLDDELLQMAREHAARGGQTLSQVVEDAPGEVLARYRTSDEQRRIRLPTDPGDGRGLLPGVDLDDSAGLNDLLD